MADSQGLDLQPDTTSPAWPSGASLQFNKVEEDSLIVRWPPATDNIAVTSYEIAQRVDGELVVIATVDGGQHALEISQLPLMSTVELTVQAGDAAGNLSQDGPDGSVQLPDWRAPRWPENAALQADVLDGSSVALSWPSATDTDGVARYLIYQDNVHIAEVDGKSTHFVADGLEPFSLVEFRVEAQDASLNTSLDGPVASVKTTDNVPPWWPDTAAVSAVPFGEERIDLGWGAAMDDAGIQGYRVLQDGIQIAQVDAAKTWLTVGGLSAGTVYIFEIFAIDFGSNDSLLPLTAQTSTLDQTEPVWPDSSWLQGSSEETSQFTLTWSAATDNVAVTHYEVYQDNVPLETVEAPETAVTVQGLQAALPYTFRVEAVDAFGNSSENGPTLLVDLSDQAPPVWPDGAVCVASEATPTSVVLSWTAATDETSVASYLVFGNDVQVAQSSGSAQSVTVTGLNALTEYVFLVVAVDGAGNASNAGPEVTLTTPDFPVPTWPADAEISLLASGPSWLTLAWTALPETESVESVVLMQDGQEVLELDGLASSTTLNGLEPLTEYEIRVEALGPTGLLSTDGPYALVSTTDYAPPEWSNSATLEATEITESSMLLTWQGVSDPSSISSFIVTQDGVEIATLESSMTSLAVDSLSSGLTYHFQVEAIGPTGLVSSTGPELLQMTLDLEAPSWPEGASLVVEWVEATAAALAWPAASDNAMVQSYQVLVNGELAEMVDGESEGVTLSELAPQTLYSVEVLALDASLNPTLESLSASFTTQSSATGLTTEEVYEGLSPHCSYCHAGQPTPFFESFGSFESLVAWNDELVVPGDPDGSALIQMLEGNGAAPWVQMPLSGKSFLLLSNAGETSITMAQVRAWVLHLEVD